MIRPLLSYAERRKLVLVVDDNEEIRNLISLILHESEFDCIGAADGKEGICIARNDNPDIILLDIIMQGFDGFTTASILKRNLKTRHIPIVFLSGHLAKEDIAEAVRAGGEDYIAKPFSPGDILARLRRILEPPSPGRNKQ